MLSLQDFGSFYIAGNSISIKGQSIQKVMRNDHTEIELDPNGEYNNGAMYVQYYKPTISTGTYLLIHGGGMSGAVWDIWVKKLLSLNKTVYIVDSVGVGRSGYCPFDPNLSTQNPELRSYERTWTHFRLGSQEDFESKKTYKNSQFQEKNFEDFTKQNIPRWNNYVEPSVEAIKELLKRKSHWNIIAHSQGADIALRLLDNFSVKNILLIEPAAFPDLKKRPHFPQKSVSFLYGDYIDSEHSAFWADLFKKAEQYQEALALRGIKTTMLKLPDHEIYGNTHAPMCDKNSEEVFELAISLIED
jgi:pimeloyl-ACP methyl ester carboxylesterase